MPQAVRRESAQTSQTMQDKELKRARGAISCAECRRLKLKCDKIVPCSSCKRRGCSAICPNGSLKTGQGTRFVLADTEKLHHKIAQMSDRIRQLEDALALLQSTMTHEPHPLLGREFMRIKSSIDLHSAVDDEENEGNIDTAENDESPLDAFGTLAIRDDGGATFYGRSAGSESLLVRESADSPESTPPLPSTQVFGQDYGSPSVIQHFSSMFPFEPTYASVSFGQLRSYLPQWGRASSLFHLYLEVAPWFFGVVTQRQVQEEIIPLWFPESDVPHPPAMNNDATPTSPGGSSPRENSHELAMVFMVLCFGALTDLDLPPAPDNPDAEQFYSLAKAAIGLEPLLDRSPSISTVQTLAMMGIYEGLRNKDNGIEATWMLMGMACKMAQSIGLHRDSARFKLPPGEVQKRRALFWELFITDCWQSLATGRLATFSLPFVDCELPGDPDQTMAEDGTPQPSFPYWKARFGAECVAAVSQGVLTARAPRYSIILDLDRKVRNMELPKYAQGDPPAGAGLRETMLHFMPINYKELTLQYIHRCFYAHALTSSTDPMKSEYAPSFTAGYLSAKTLISSVKQQFLLFPKQMSRFWILWTHAFSSSVMLSSAVTHSPKTKVAHAALLELRGALELFEMAASHGGRAVKFLPIIRRLHTQAQHVFLETNSGVPPRIPNDIFRPSNQEDDRDDLLVFSGKTTTVTTKLRSTASQSSSARSSMSPAQPQQSAQEYANNPSFAEVHPVLIYALDRFDGQITAQLQDAFYSSRDAFSGGSQTMPPPTGPQRPRIQVPGDHQTGLEFQSGRAFAHPSSPTYRGPPQQHALRHSTSQTSVGAVYQQQQQHQQHQHQSRRPSISQDTQRRASVSLQRERTYSMDVQQQQVPTPPTSTDTRASTSASHRQPSHSPSGSACEVSQYPSAIEVSQYSSTAEFAQYTFPRGQPSPTRQPPVRHPSAQQTPEQVYGQQTAPRGHDVDGIQGSTDEAKYYNEQQQQHMYQQSQHAYSQAQDHYAYALQQSRAQQMEHQQLSHTAPQHQQQQQHVQQSHNPRQSHDYNSGHRAEETPYHQSFADAYPSSVMSYGPTAGAPKPAVPYGSVFAAAYSNGTTASSYASDPRMQVLESRNYADGRSAAQNPHHQAAEYAPGPAVRTYAPELAMHGTAADDYRLQATWQDYMITVASPPPL
ncbi:fungal-specific transcription factor domain-containing protein [Schizophyllum amplum]|uniref:Fungal-specific transcription factor domain-containing protein n=1 Tax=Schizophyllum amplum TaxID=97359 RepID=A0A550CQ60_9AGAR|nr:fungal-specific transcription factor domain-containing protein [Auriculariopsis ampla]